MAPRLKTVLVDRITVSSEKKWLLEKVLHGIVDLTLSFPFARRRHEIFCLFVCLFVLFCFYCVVGVELIARPVRAAPIKMHIVITRLARTNNEPCGHQFEASILHSVLINLANSGRLFGSGAVFHRPFSLTRRKIILST